MTLPAADNSSVRARIVELNRLARKRRASARITTPDRPKPERHPVPLAPMDKYFDSLFAAYGPQHWWPGKTPFEVIVGAILVQNTSWTNVERAIAKLQAARLLTPTAIGTVPITELESLIRCSGYFRQKALKLKAFCEFLRTEYGGSLKRMFATRTTVLSEKLLGIFGIGPETADSILLYAGQHSVFVADAYAKRMLARHGWLKENAKYEDARRLVESQFSGSVERFNEFHALIVHTGKRYCRPQAGLCGECPLGPYLRKGR